MILGAREYSVAVVQSAAIVYGFGTLTVRKVERQTGKKARAA